MRSQLHFVITAAVVCHLFVGAPLVTSQAHPQDESAQNAPAQSGPCHVVLTAPPATRQPGPAADENGKTVPASDQVAKKSKPKFAISESQPVTITARECEEAGEVYTLRGDVEITFADNIFHGDTVTYDRASGNATVTGNASFDGGRRDMHITASHGTYNVHSQTGLFYDVKGTTGARLRGRNVTLTSSNPIAFTGRTVAQTGPDEYVLHHGSVTSCELPHPKWTFNAEKIILRVGTSAKVYHTTFRLKGVPVFYLPYVAPPVERLGRQSGFLIPNFGTSSSKGTILGDSFYWAINRSMDATLGGEYLSKRGWSLQESFHSKPTQNSYLNLNYFQVLDRGLLGKDADGKPKRFPQGGEDVKLVGETMFAHEIRGVASMDYLSSFLFRLAFTDNFSQAVDSEVKSTAFVAKNIQGFSLNAFGSRYQNFQSKNNSDVITILHIPGIEIASVDRPIARLPLYWSADVAAEGLRRSQPGFVTPGVVGRFDVDPEISLPVFYRGWTFRPEVALHNTIYSQQQTPTPATPIYDVLNRRAIESSFEIRPPTLGRVFDHTLAGRKIKHTIEPRVVYRYTNGIESFPSIIHFDFRDILSNTNEVEVGLVQRLYFKHAHADCTEPGKDEVQPTPLATECAPAGADEFISWEVKQKYFFDPNFGGALNGRRTVLTTTADFTGIAFLTEPRRSSPIVSRLRLRTSSGSDVEWQLDYDSKKGRINASTFYTSFRLGEFFIGGSHAYLQVPGEIVTNPGTTIPLPPCRPHVFNQDPCVPPVFNQFRALLGYGGLSKKGWSAAANVGFDREFNLVQYSAAQTAYNWDCCGISFEYRRFALGSVVRNENQYRFAFTLANIGSFGNLKRQERLF